MNHLLIDEFNLNPCHHDSYPNSWKASPSKVSQAMVKGRDQHPSIFSVHPIMSGIRAQTLLEIMLYFLPPKSQKEQQSPHSLVLRGSTTAPSPVQMRAEPTTMCPLTQGWYLKP